MNNTYNGVLRQSSTDFNEVRDGRRSPVYYIDIDLTNARSSRASTALVLPIAGNTFFVDKNPDLVGPATVHIQDVSYGNAPAPVYCEPGFICRAPFTQLMIENAAQPGKVLRLHYGVDIDFVPGAGSSVNVTGSVSVIDGGKSRTLSGIAFLGNVSAAGSAGNYTHVQLWNPANSGKNLVIGQISVNSPNLQGITFRSHNVALASLYGPAQNKMLGSAASFAQMRYEYAAAYIPVTSDILTVSIAASVAYPYKPTEPIIIPPGFGLVAYTNNFLNTPLAATYDFYVD